MSIFRPFRPRHRITLERAVKTLTGAGGYTTEWRTDETIWTEFMGLGSDETLANQQQQNRITQKCRIRYRENMTTTGYRVNFKGRIMNIDSLYDPDESRRFLYMRLVEVAA